MWSFAQICEDLGVSIASSKTVGPTQVLVDLGLETDTLEMCVKVPDLLLSFLSRKKITLKELQSLSGSLNFCARAIPGAVDFNRRFYDASIGMVNPNHHLRLSSAMKEDIHMWLMFLECFDGSVFFPEREWSDSSRFQLFTDSAGRSQLGCAAILGSRWSFPLV